MATHESVEQVLKWLEETCATMFTNPATASQALLAFRDQERTLEYVQHILFTPDVVVTEVVQHQCVAALQSSGLRNWNSLDHEQRQNIVSQCWLRVVSNDITHMVRHSLIQTCVLFWKRGWPILDENDGGWKNETKQGLFETMKQAMVSDNEQMRCIAANLLATLVVEFGSTKANAMGLPLEFHREAHTAFETDRSLEGVLQLGMELLSSSVSACSSIDKRAEEAVLVSLLTQLRSATSLVAEVLLWQHGVLDIWAIPSSEKLLRPPESWRPILVQPQFLGCIFTAYRAARILPFNLQGQARINVLEVAHEVRQLLIILASLSGHIFQNDNERSAYATFMLQGTVELVSSPIDIELACVMGVSTVDIKEASAGESRDMATMFRRLVANFNLRFCLSPIPELPAFLSKLASATSYLLRGAVASAQIERDELDDLWQLQSANTMLEGWAHLAAAARSVKQHPGENIPNCLVAAVNCLDELVGPLFSSFIYAHLDIASADAQHVLEDDSDELGEEAATDELGSSLDCCASLGRLCPHVALPLLTCLLTSTEPLPPSIHAVAGSQFGSGGSSLQLRLGRTSSIEGQEISPDDQVTLDALRILILSSGYLLADSGDGEVPAVPATFLHPSIMPLVVQLSSAVFTLCELELSHLSSHPFHPMRSPLLAETLLWFNCRWSLSYFESDPSLYPPDLDINLLASLTNASLVQLLVRCFIMYGSVWPHEQKVIYLGCDLLSAFTRPKRFLNQRLLVSQECFKELIISNGTSLTDSSMFPGRLTHECREKLMAELVAGSLTDLGSFEALMTPLEVQLQQLVSMSEVDLTTHGTEAVHLLLRLLCGVTLGASSATQELVVRKIFSYLEAIQELKRKVAHDVTILEPFLLLAKNTAEALLPFTDPARTMSFFIFCESLLTTYGRLSQAERRNTEAIVDEMQIVLDLLSFLLAKDFIDFAQPAVGQPVDAIAIVFAGLLTVLPNISTELLLVPNICQAFFGLVGHLCSDYADRFKAIPTDLSTSLTQSIDFGIRHDSASIARESLRGVEGLVTSGAISQEMAMKWLTDIFQLVIFQDGVWDRMDAFADALFALCCAQRAELENFVGMVMSTQTTEVHRQRLGTEFQQLFTLNGLQFELNRPQRITFRKNLKNFVTKTRAFMRTN